MQAQVQAQLTGVRDRAYKEGYERGQREGRELAKKVLITETEKSNRKISEYRNDRSELEQELFDRDRSLAKANDKIQDLEIQLQWLRKAAHFNGKTAPELLKQQNNDSRDTVRKLAEKMESLKADPVAIKNNPSVQLDKQREMQAKIIDVNKRIADINEKLGVWERENSRIKRAAENLEMLGDMEKQAAEWAKKTKADLKLSKNTLYGTLGLLIWATDADIDAAYEKLAKRYSNTSNPENAEKLKAVKAAYSVLADPKRRREYNLSIGYESDRIATERRLIKDNERAQETYRNKLAAKEFWQRFDELSSLALSGDADAQNLLGTIYYNGKNVETDYVQAVYWFKEAVEQRHPAAIYNLGLCYLNGNGVKRNHSIGMAFMRQAANLGYAPEE